MSTQYRFTFRYKDGSTYDGTVADDGTIGYTVGEQIGTPYGVYSIDSSVGFVALSAGTISVAVYHDAATQADYVPLLYSEGQAQGGGLGAEYDSITGPRGTSVFGNGGLYKATESGANSGPIVLYDFAFTYGDGSFYVGTVFDNGSLGYFDGQKVYTAYGVYALSIHTGAIDPGLFKSVGAVRTTSYHDARTGTTYTTYNAKSSGGGRGLTTETDSITPAGSSAILFGEGGRYQASVSGETQFTFTFTYRDGSSYSGTVADDGSYGYAVGQTIATGHGSYHIDSATAATGYYRQAIGTVFVTTYVDVSSGSYRPIYGFQGLAAGAGGLGSEHDFIDDGNGHRKPFGGGGVQEARLYGNTLFTFRFTYADGSYYVGSVVDDGRYGYYPLQTIKAAGGTYSFYYFTAATEAPAGTVKISSYSDAASNAVFTPYHYSRGEVSGSAGLGSEYDFTKGANNYQAFGQGGTFEARQSGSTLYDFTFRYTDGSHYEGQVADNDNFGTRVGKTIAGVDGSYYIYGTSGGTALAAGTVVVASYYDISTRSAYTPSLAGQGRSDGASGLGSEYDYTDGAGGHLDFGQGGAFEARQDGNPVYRFSFTYRDGSAYYGTVADGGGYGYAVGQVIPTGYGTYRLYASAGYSAEAAGTVHVARYDDITSQASYVPGYYAQGKASGDNGLGFEIDYTHGAAGDVGFGVAGAYEARQAPNQILFFRFTYRDGSSYDGTVSDDGSFGYAVGQTIPTAYGQYDIYRSGADTTLAGVTTSVISYYDVYSGRSYTPQQTALGRYDGDNGLGFEEDTIVGAAGALPFGLDGSLEARQAPYTSFSFYFKYTDGSFYYGTVSDPSYTYAAGQTVTTPYGFYHLDGAHGITADAPGTVRVSSYYDVSSRAFFTPSGYAAGNVAGTGDLGSEVDATTGDGGTQRFGAGGLYEARQDATTLYDFRFDYADGSFYLGRVADDGRYHYQVGQFISTRNGAYSITGQEGATTLTPGKVYTTLYYDVFSDLYPDTRNPSPLYTPVLYQLGYVDGTAGLGSEYDSTHAGIYRGFGRGEYESKNYYTHEYPITPPYPAGLLPAVAVRVLAFAPAAQMTGGTTLFTFTFTYADGSRYAGTVADDGSLGYSVGLSIAATGGAYVITGMLDAAGTASGTVSVTSYFDITTGQVTPPDLFAAGKPAGTGGLGSEQDSIGGNRGPLPFGRGGTAEARQGIAQFAFGFTYADGSAYAGTVADDGSLGYAVGQTIATAYGSYLITGAAGTTGRASGSVAVGSYTDAATGASYAPDGTLAAVGAMAVLGTAGLGSETGTVTGAAGTQSFGQGGAQEASLGIPLFRFTFTYADGSTYRGTVADDGRLGYSAGQVVVGTGGQYVVGGQAGTTAAAAGTVSVAAYRDAATGLLFIPDLTAGAMPDGTGGLGSEQDTVTVAGTAYAFGKAGALEAGGAVPVYAFRFDYADGSSYRGTVADDGSLGYAAGQTIAAAAGTYTITARTTAGSFRAAGSVTVAGYFDATTGLSFVPDAGSVSGVAGLGSETGTVTGNQGAKPFGQGGVLEASQAARSFDFAFTYPDGSAYTGTVADDGRYGYAVDQVIATARGAYRILDDLPPTASAAGAVRVSRYLDAIGGASFVPLLTAAGMDDGSAGLGSEFDTVTQLVGMQAFGLGGAYEASGGAPCYCRGTLILTDRGEVPVEALAIGDRVITRDGAAKPIRWIGTRSYAGRFLRGRPALQPVRFRPGSLGAGLPRRDLLVSPDHAMFLDGVLVPAALLVNGTGIERARALERVAYFHVELDAHDVIYAEGAGSETFLDDDSRGLFHNAADHAARYPGPAGPGRFCAPRVEAGEALEAICRRLAHLDGGCMAVRHAG